MNFQHVFVLVFLMVSQAKGAISPLSSVPNLVVTPSRPMAFIGVGVAKGGRAADGFTMLQVQHEVASDMERIGFQYGDFAGNVVPNQVGYFHLSVEPKQKRLVLNLSQIDRTAVGPEQFKQLLRASKLVSSSQLSTDPLDGSTEIVLNTVAPVEARVILSNAPKERHTLWLEFRRPKDRQ